MTHRWRCTAFEAAYEQVLARLEASADPHEQPETLLLTFASLDSDDDPAPSSGRRHAVGRGSQDLDGTMH